MKPRCVFVMIMFGLLFVFTATGICQEKTTMNDWVVKVGQGSINWTAGYIEAVGIAAPPDRSVNKINARPMVLRAAKADALRNLLEIVKGIQVDSKTTIRAYMVESDIINTQVSGLVQGAMVADQQYIPDGTVEVKLKMSLYGDLARTVLPPAIEKRKSSAPPVSTPPVAATPSVAPPPAIPLATPTATTPPAPSPAAATSATTPPASTPPAAAAPAALPAPLAYTGVVVDARGIQAQPAISPRIFDENGIEIYGFVNVDREYALKQGVSGYARDLAAAQQNQRVTAKPLIVKALKTSGAGKTDFIISNADAQQIRAAETSTEFIKQWCRMIIVLD